MSHARVLSPSREGKVPLGPPRVLVDTAAAAAAAAPPAAAAAAAAAAASPEAEVSPSTLVLLPSASSIEASLGYSKVRVAVSSNWIRCCGMKIREKKSVYACACIYGEREKRHSIVYVGMCVYVRAAFQRELVTLNLSNRLHTRAGVSMYVCVYSWPSLMTLVI